MDVFFEKSKLRKSCQSSKELQRAYGKDNGRRIGTRLAQLAAAPRLADLRRPAPGRCHELTADRAGQLSLDVKDPLRLIFRPEPFPGPTLPDGGLDWSRVEAVVVIEIADTH